MVAAQIILPTLANSMSSLELDSLRRLRDRFSRNAPGAGGQGRPPSTLCRRSQRSASIVASDASFRAVSELSGRLEKGLRVSERAEAGAVAGRRMGKGGKKAQKDDRCGGGAGMGTAVASAPRLVERMVRSPE